MFGKFNKVVMIERIIRSILWGLGISLIFYGLIIIISKLIWSKVNYWAIGIINVLICIFSSNWLYKYVFLAEEKEIAKRLDNSAHLNECIQTMVEYQRSDNSMVKLQRNDATKRLEELPNKTLKIKVDWKALLNLIVGAIILCLGLILPNRTIIIDDPLLSNQPSTSEVISQGENSSNGSNDITNTSNNDGTSSDTSDGNGNNDNDNQTSDNQQDGDSNGHQDGDNNDNGEDGQGQGNGNGSSGNGDGNVKYASDDLVYDPVTGNYVTYGELLNEYWAEVLDAIENSNISDELASLIEQYFNSLYN